MEEKRDKLGRRIPQFDRSAAAKKGAVTKKGKYGNDYYSRISRNADRSKNRGYLGKLKDEGRIEELRSIADKGRKIRKSHFSRLKEEGRTEELRAISKKGLKKRHARSGNNNAVRGK